MNNSLKNAGVVTEKPLKELTTENEKLGNLDGGVHDMYNDFDDMKRNREEAKK